MKMADNQQKVVVRMAPSPTGYFHVGSARTALFNFLFARKHGGTFIFRSEDTNDERSKREFENNIIDCLKWLGLDYDLFVRQSERQDLYKSYVKKMLDNETAYISKEHITEVGKRGEVIRLRNPNKKITFNDVVRGKIEFDTTESGDFIIAKSISEPLYHLAVVVDDHEMNITHVIRGEDILSSTPRHILIQEAIGAKQPIYAHIPLILATDRSKLSKRHGATSVTDYKDRGILPSALINFLAFLGWNPGGQREIFTLEELVEIFDLSKVQKGGAIFDEKKLMWFNREHMKKLPEDVILSEIKENLVKSSRLKDKGWKIDEILLKRAQLAIFERIERWSDVKDMANNGDLDYLFERPEIQAELLMPRALKDSSAVERHLISVIELLGSHDENSWTADNIKAAVWNFATETGRNNVLWPMRVALCGKEKSPDPFTLSYILGKNETLYRLRSAIDILSKNNV